MGWGAPEQAQGCHEKGAQSRWGLGVAKARAVSSGQPLNSPWEGGEADSKSSYLFSLATPITLPLQPPPGTQTFRDVRFHKDLLELLKLTASAFSPQLLKSAVPTSTHDRDRVHS